MSSGMRERREVIREEPWMGPRILEALAAGPRTVPELAAALGRPANEVMFWMMGLRKYGYLTEIREPGDDAFYRYRAVEREV